MRALTVQPLFAERFYELLNQGAVEAHSVLLDLRNVLHPHAGLQQTPGAQGRCGQEIVDEACDRLVRTPVAGLDREDIADLSISLLKLSRSAKRLESRLAVTPLLPATIGLGPQSESLEKASALLVEMVEQLRRGLHLGTFHRLHAQLLSQLEEAEERMEASRSKLISSKCTPLQVIMIDHLHHCMDQIIDFCNEAASITNRICLANN